MSTRNAYPSDVSEDEWSFVAPYLTLMTEDAPQRDHPLRGVFNGLRWLVRTGSPWRYLPNDLPPWYTVYQQTHRWIAAGCFGGIVHNLRELLRVAGGRKAQPSAVVLDGRTLQSSIESGSRAGYDGYKVKRGSTHWLIETKGLVSVDVAHKNRAATLWCENATLLTGTEWRYIIVHQSDFEQLQPDLYSDLYALQTLL